MKEEYDDNSYMLSGVKVEFPNKPYPTQIAMMSKVINALKLQQNALLESPTGTGSNFNSMMRTLFDYLTYQAKHLLFYAVLSLGKEKIFMKEKDLILSLHRMK